MKWSIPVIGTVAVSVFGNAAVGAQSGTAVGGGGGGSRQDTVITVDFRSDDGPVRLGLLGVNHHYDRNSRGLWNVATDSPEPAVVSGARRAGVQLVRYPGGTPANLFDWKQAVGGDRGCQTDGKKTAGGFPRVAGGQAYGPDEHMEFVSAIDAEAAIMVPVATETPADAADWVEYMNSPSGTVGNPNGGVDWADVRARNGHPGAYRVRRWEIGNEQRTRDQRYWMSADDDVAVRQYANGGHRDVFAEALGKECAHPNVGIPSDGTANQLFEVLFPPVIAKSVEVTVAGQRWRQVDTLAAAAADARAYVVRPEEGLVRFGDGVHGAVPPRDAVVRASYRSAHQGFFAFARAMKAVDPTIRVCATWGLPAFVEVAGNRPYDCFVAHSYTHFAAEGHDQWDNPLEGHDWHMLGAATERRFVADLSATVPAGIPIPLSEFGALWGDAQTFPHWMASMTHVLYMATQWIHWMQLNIPWAAGNDLVTANDRGLIGPPPQFTYTAEAATRQALMPMFSAGGRQLAARVTGNPVRDPHLSAGTYSALKAAASRGRNGNLYLLVVNRLPNDDVAVDVKLNGFTSNGSAAIRSVEGATFTSWNAPDQAPAVTLEESSRTIRSSGFQHNFPAHSVTLLQIPPA